MTFSLYDYVAADGTNEFADWTRNLEKRPRAKLNAKIDLLALHGEELMPHVLTDTPIPGIRKLRVRGNVELRPILCRGPQIVATEYTFLLGAIERGNDFEPREAPATADARRSVVAANPNRRCTHERVN